MCIVPEKVIGVMRMLDGGELNDKIIAVTENDLRLVIYMILRSYCKLELDVGGRLQEGFDLGWVRHATGTDWHRR